MLFAKYFPFAGIEIDFCGGTTGSGVVGSYNKICPVAFAVAKSQQ